MPPDDPPFHGTRVQGNVVLTPGSRGNAFVFLYPDRAAGLYAKLLPVKTTAVSDVRLAKGDFHYLFAELKPNPYRLGGLLDVDRNLSFEVDVLAQATAGDRLSSSYPAFNLQPGAVLTVDLPIDEAVAREPPAFRLEGHAGDVLVLPDQPALIPLTLVSTDLGLLDPSRSGFEVRVADEDGDGRADDADGDGLPDLHPRIALRFLPGPGQTEPTGASGRTGPVLLPLAFNPAPFLAALAGDLTRSVVVDRLQAFVVPRAVVLTSAPGRGAVTEALDAIPIGDCELWVLQPNGQYWRLPNGLGPSHPDQAVRFSVVHGSAFDGGTP